MPDGCFTAHNVSGRWQGARKSRRRDPVDHFLVASAQVFDVTLVTADVRLFTLESVRILRGRA